MNKHDKAAVLKSRNFRWLMGGGLVSMLGDQFTMVAFPWLVLKLTGNALATASVIALMALPRAIFILVGGAVVDRYSPKTVLMLTKYINTVLLGVLAFLLITDQLTMPIVYGFSLAIGLSSAFSIPSGTSIMPLTMEPELLQAANGVMMAMRQMTMLVGPLLAGLVIAFAGDSAHPGAVTDARGLSVAFGFDAFSFALSAWTLSHVQQRQLSSKGDATSILHSVAEGLAHLWRDVPMRSVFAYWGLLACIIGGSFQVALPVLADSRLSGAAALGLLMAAHGIGSFVGMALTGALGNLRVRNLGTTLLLVDFTAGLIVMPLGWVTAVWQGAALLLILGSMGGFMQVSAFTWFQRRVPPAMMGRTMSMFMFIFMGLAPLSSVVAGWLLTHTSLQNVFMLCGATLVTMVVLAFAFTPIRHIADPAPN